MKPVAESAGAEPFFLRMGSGQRYCMYHAPAAPACVGAVLYVHPFGDEMNKARRMAALQARTLAAQGFGVLQIDLFGCGDSSGEFAEASWEDWKDDLRAADDWLRQRLNKPICLWGLRLGTLLALDYARTSAQAPAAVVLWQPVLSGSMFLTQFLRLRVASEMLAGDVPDGGDKTGGTQGLRDELRAGKTLEIAGYELSPALAAACDSLDAGNMAVHGCPVHWFEAVAEAGRPMPPATRRVVEGWMRAGVSLQTHPTPCPPFWSTQEIEEAPELLSATSRIFAGLFPSSSGRLVAGHES